MIATAAIHLSPAGLASICGACVAVAAAIVGVMFRGAASAWRDERDAAVDKANRLEERITQQDVEIATLKRKVEELTSRNVDNLAERMSREHGEIVSALRSLSDETHANTTAIEFLIKQAFPTPASVVEAAR